MYDELIKELRYLDEYSKQINPTPSGIFREAADAIEGLSAKVESLQSFADNISKLPDCNTCLKKNTCEFMPRYGEYCRINCPAWLGQPPKEE